MYSITKKTASEMHVAPRIVVHCCSLLSIVAHCCPLLPIVVHCCQLLSTSSQICHDLLYHRLPHTATDWPKCFCIYRLKGSKAISEWVWDGIEWKSLKAPGNLAMVVALANKKTTQLGERVRQEEADTRLVSVLSRPPPRQESISCCKTCAKNSDKRSLTKR